ncbi:glutamate receptor ionotropic, delta-1-like [Oratosquilla oratoria]|uniref:glutamate receptor ionotropic, delta-1-like n=1 Tax=Oratosquilla oratoria TaxID=337810 RepID=UPI003F76C785
MKEKNLLQPAFDMQPLHVVFGHRSQGKIAVRLALVAGQQVIPSQATLQMVPGDIPRAPTCLSADSRLMKHANISGEALSITDATLERVLFANYMSLLLHDKSSRMQKKVHYGYHRNHLQYAAIGQDCKRVHQVPKHPQHQDNTAGRFNHVSQLPARIEAMVKHLVIGAEQWVPWLRISKSREGSNVYSGIMHDLLLSMSTALNFTYELRRPPDGLWGVGFPNGSWSGMMGMVKRREVDFALGPFAVNWERFHHACDFTQPIYVDYEGVFMRRPRIEIDLFAFVRPFGPMTWACVLASLMVVWVVLVLVSRTTEERNLLREASPKSETLPKEISPKKGRTGGRGRGHRDKSSYLLWILRCITSQSNTWHPVSGSCRIVAGTWVFVSLVLLTLFSGTLIAMLTVPKVQLPIDSTQDLVTQSKLPWAIESGSFLYQMLYTATSGIYKAIWDGHTHLITDCYSFRLDIKEGTYAAVCDKMTMKKVMSEDFSVTGDCNFYMAREDFKAMPMSLGFQKGHPLFERANKWILRFVERGMVANWIAQEIPNSTSCQGLPGSSLVGVRRPLSLQDYYGVLSIFTGVKLKNGLKGDIVKLKDQLKGVIAKLKNQLKGVVAKLKNQLKVKHKNRLKGVIVKLKKGLKGVIVKPKKEFKGVIVKIKRDFKGVIVKLKNELKGLKVKLKNQLKGVIVKLKNQLKGVIVKLKKELQGCYSQT